MFYSCLQHVANARTRADRPIHVFNVRAGACETCHVRCARTGGCETPHFEKKYIIIRHVMHAMYLAHARTYKTETTHVRSERVSVQN